MYLVSYKLSYLQPFNQVQSSHKPRNKHNKSGKYLINYANLPSSSDNLNASTPKSWLVFSEPSKGRLIL